MGRTEMYGRLLQVQWVSRVELTLSQVPRPEVKDELRNRWLCWPRISGSQAARQLGGP